MANLPVNKDFFDEGPVRGELLWLDEKQIKQIEARGRIRLSNALIAELSFAIDGYVTATSRRPPPAPNRAKTRRHFRAVKKSLGQLAAALAATGTAEGRDMRHRLESELWFLARADRAAAGDIPGLTREQQKRLTEVNGGADRPLVDTGRFQAEIAALGHAADRALDRLEREAREARKNAYTKSRKEVAFAQFLDDLEGIYGRAAGIRGSFVNFLLAVHDAMPPKNRPRLPEGWAEMGTDDSRGKK